ncbi:MAG: iron ABC transporter permease [Bacteroidales bacterium]|nr:iron ABC transporter permease [Bacteroidales bacterium]
MDKKRTYLFLLLTVVLVAGIILDIYIGSAKISISDIWNIITGRISDTPEAYIVHQIRFPRVIVALLAGVSLSIAGLQMQTVFRNPLAGPYVLGISSGSSLGVALVLLGSSVFGYTFGGFMGDLGIIIAALAGAAFILMLVLFVSVRVKDVMTILILGILFGGATSAVVSVLQFFSDEFALKSYVVWTLGSLSGVSVEQLSMIVPIVITGILISFALSKRLDVYLLGETYAKSLGSNVFMIRLFVFISTCLLAGTITAFCGPIGFVGIAAPHISRMMFKTSKHLYLMTATILTGGIMMIASDIISQLPGTEKVLPINSVTALLGIPVVVWIIFKNFKYSKAV